MNLPTQSHNHTQNVIGSGTVTPHCLATSVAELVPLQICLINHIIIHRMEIGSGRLAPCNLATFGSMVLVPLCICPHSHIVLRRMDVGSGTLVSHSLATSGAVALVTNLPMQRTNMGSGASPSLPPPTHSYTKDLDSYPLHPQLIPATPSWSSTGSLLH